MVNRDGIVCAVAFTGHELRRSVARQPRDLGPEGEYGQRLQPARQQSRGLHGALSSGNLYGVVLEQGSLFGLQFSNPVDPSVAYKGPASRFGQANDPMVGSAIGGVNVFGGGLALYDSRRQPRRRSRDERRHLLRRSHQRLAGARRPQPRQHPGWRRPQRAPTTSSSTGARSDAKQLRASDMRFRRRARHQRLADERSDRCRLMN